VSLWSELRRRKVVRVVVAYMIAAGGVAQGADVFLPELGAPSWVVPVILVLLILGLPLALVLAWAYQITPEGLVRDDGGVVTVVGSAPTTAARPTPSTAAPTQPDSPTHRPARSDGRPSVAVLPLTNMSGDPDNEFFSDGVTEDILTHLSCVKGLRVTSRTSVMQYKGTTKTVREIARELDVDSVLEGSIRVAAGKVRVTVQLIDADADDHLWAEAYDRSLEDVFAVQSEVAEAVASALKAELSPQEVERIRAQPTENVEAYTLCLRGEEAMTSWAPADLDRAVEYFEAALKLDPEFARPHAALALVLAIGPVFTGRTPHGLHARIEEAALKALEVDSQLGLAHAALGTVKWSRDYDWAAAEAAFQRAIDLEPRSTLVRGSLVFFLVMQERFDEALHQYEEVDAGPRETILVRGSSSFAYYFSGRAEEGLALVEEGLAYFPNSPTLLYHKGLALGHLERYEEAERALRRAYTIDPELALAVAVRALYLGALGRTDELRAEFDRLMNWEGAEPVGAHIKALAHQALGDLERALDFYEQAVEERDFLVPFIRSSPRMRPLRAHPRFQALLQRMWPDHGPFEVEGPV
jgi:adenylate cyclase